MQEFLWTIFGWICKGIGVLLLISLVFGFISYIQVIVRNGGRSWYYYNPSKPWEGGYWEPLLPSYPPYNEYKWNPKTCRFEHKKTGQPLHPWEKPLNDGKCLEKRVEWDWDALGLPEEKPANEIKESFKRGYSKKKRPVWIRLLFEETPATLWKKHKQKKWVKERENNDHSRW